MLVEYVELLADHFERSCLGDRYHAAMILAGKMRHGGWKKTLEDVRLFRAGFGKRGRGEVNRPREQFESQADRDTYVRYLHIFEQVPKEILAEQTGSTPEEIDAICSGDLE
jgi:hypothetical protein